MNVKNLAKQCEMVIKLSNGKPNAELNYVYNTAKEMIDAGMGNAHDMLFRALPDNVKLKDVCELLRNLRFWNINVIADIQIHYEWQKVARMREITQIGDEYAIRYHM